jgi:hypothetical protein
VRYRLVVVVIISWDNVNESTKKAPVVGTDALN